MTTMTDMTDEEAIKSIVDCANGDGFDKATVENLARYFSMGTIFTTSINNNNQPPYSVGLKDTSKPTEKDRMYFEDSLRVFQGTKSRRDIKSAFVVPMRQAAGPPLPFMSLNLAASATGPKVVLTNQLSGCTVAIGAVRDKLHMAHAQPEPPAQLSVDSRGKKLAAALRQGGPNIFEGLKEAAGLSTFLIHPGDTVEHTASTICYGTKIANVLGLVLNQGASYTLAIIVAIQNRGFDQTIEQVLLVTHENSTWTTKVVEAT